MLADRGCYFGLQFPDVSPVVIAGAHPLEAQLAATQPQCVLRAQCGSAVTSGAAALVPVRHILKHTPAQPDLSLSSVEAHATATPPRRAAPVLHVAGPAPSVGNRL